MLMFLIGLAGFFGLHLLPFHPQVRAKIVASIGGGESLYKLVFAVANGFALMLVGLGKGKAPFIELWSAPTLLRYLSIPVVYAATVLVLAAYLPNNIRHFIPHPMLTGVMVWAIIHLAVNGDLVSLLLFFSFVVYAVHAIKKSKQREADSEAMPATKSWYGDLLLMVLRRAGIKVPRATIVPWYRDIILLLLAFLVFALLASGHDLLFSRPILLS